MFDRLGRDRESKQAELKRRQRAEMRAAMEKQKREPKRIRDGSRSARGKGVGGIPDNG